MTETTLQEIPTVESAVSPATPRDTEAEARTGRPPLVRLLLSIGFTSASLFVGTLLSAVATVLVARRMGADDWGRSATAASWALLGSSVVLFGTPTRLTRDLAGGESPRLFGYYWRRICRLAALTMPIVGLAVWAALGVDLALLTAVLFVLLALRQAANVPYQAERRFGSAAVVTIAERFGLLACTGAFLALGHVTVETYLVAQVFGTAVALVLLVPHGLRWSAGRTASTGESAPSSDASPPPRPPWSQLWSSRSSFGYAAIGVAIAQLDISTVLMFADRHEAGLFALASRLVGPLALIGSATATVLLPTLASGASGLKVKKDKRRLLLAAVVVISLVFVWFGPEILSTVLGPDYRAAESVIRLYCVSTLLVIVNQPAVAWLQAHRRDESLRYLLLGGTAIHLIGTASGAALGGATGAGWGYLVSNVLILGVLALLIFRGSPVDGHV